MRRTQLYLEDDLWNALHAHADSAGTSISQLVREALRERYLGNLDERRKAMQAFVGIRQNRKDLADTETYVRNLRRGQRLDNLYRK